MLVSVAQQSESAICIHMSPYTLPLESPSHPPYPTPLGHRKALSRSPSAMLLLPTSQLFYIRQCMYVDATLTSPQLHPHNPCPQVRFLCLSPYSCPATRFISTIFFLDSMYMCQHTVFVSLFLTYFTLYDTLYVHPPHYK